MVPLAHAHRAARLGQADGDAEFREGLDEDLGRREGAEIDDGPGPVEESRPGVSSGGCRTWWDFPGDPRNAREAEERAVRRS